VDGKTIMGTTDLYFVNAAVDMAVCPFFLSQLSDQIPSFSFFFRWGGVPDREWKNYMDENQLATILQTLYRK
jgi:hypothetical protein